MDYNERCGWHGFEDRALYHVTDKRTGKSHVRNCYEFRGVGPEVTIRLATAAEAREAGWPDGWIVYG